MQQKVYLSLYTVMFISSYGHFSVKETEISWYRLLIEIDST